MSSSKDQTKFKYITKDINNFETVQEVLDYIAGDDREDVIDAAKLRISEIDPEHPFIKAPEAAAPNEETLAPAPGAASQEGATMKQGQVETITKKPTELTEFKMIRKEAKSSVITIRGGKAVKVEFDEDGKEIQP